MCPAAYDETEGRCVPHQLAAVLQKQLNLEEADMDWLFEVIFDELYPRGRKATPTS